jgi:hypothetical protein
MNGIYKKEKVTLIMVLLMWHGSVESAEIAISNVYRKGGTSNSRFSLAFRIRLQNDSY